VVPRELVGAGTVSGVHLGNPIYVYSVRHSVATTIQKFFKIQKIMNNGYAHNKSFKPTALRAAA